MKKNILFIFIFIVFAEAVWAVPQYINYQGILRNSNGTAQSGTFNMIFKIYDAVTGGTAVYNSAGTVSSVSVSNGLYNVQLGPVDSTIFTGADRWLEVTVGNDTLTPRLKINSVAYAIYAGTAATAETVSDGAITGAKLASDINISTTGATTTGALSVSGALSVTTGTNKSVGTSSVPAGIAGVTITNSLVTASSLIFLTIGNCANPESDASEALKVSDFSTGQFTVKTIDGNNDSGSAIPFSYLIIN